MNQSNEKDTELWAAIIEAREAAADLAAAIAKAYQARGFDYLNSQTLMNGLVSEVGELADVLNIWLSTTYMVRPEKMAKARAQGLPAQIAHELGDVLTYAAALSLCFEVTPDFAQWAAARELVAGAILREEQQP